MNPIFGLKAGTRVSIAASISFLLVTAFKWTLVDWLSPFGYMPLAAILFLVFVAAGLYSLIVAIAGRRTGPVAVVPVAIQVATALVCVTVPFDSITIQASHRLYRQERESVLALAREGKLGPDVLGVDRPVSVAKLPRALSGTSADGEVLVAGKGRDVAVFFFFFRGLLSSYSGFIYAPDGQAPVGEPFNSTWSEIKRLDRHWYWVAAQ